MTERPTSIAIWRGLHLTPPGTPPERNDFACAQPICINAISPPSSHPIAYFHALSDSQDRKTDAVCNIREDWTLTDIAEWLAPIATMVAAMMTAVNLGARVTGWGFVVFTIGSVAWTIVGLGSGQVSLIAANGFLTVVNLVGIWRWLGRQRAYEDGGRSAKAASRRASSPTLFTATGIAGMPVLDGDSTPLGKAVEALIECRSGRVSYVVVATTAAGGIAEELRPVPRGAVVFECDQLVLLVPRHAFESIAPITPDSWPTSI